jgi:asparaginyl-tRNA synthetase
MSFAPKNSIFSILKDSKQGEEIRALGWVRTKREIKNVQFIALNDGSTLKNLQIVLNPEDFESTLLKKVTTGAGIEVIGILEQSKGQGQSQELRAREIRVLGEADPEKYPIQPKKHSMEFLRELGHLRPRTNTFSAIFRIRHELAMAIHQFFDENGFFYLHSPIITGSDAEGAGEMFRVTTLDLLKPPLDDQGQIDFDEDFFGRETNLTVSGQLEGELAAMALSRVYTFGPTFRAENSNTTRHLAEFWMVEPEMAFFDLEDDINLAEKMLQQVLVKILDRSGEDLEFLAKRFDDEQKQKPQNERSPWSLLERIRFVVENKFIRVPYNEAFEILRNSKPNKKRKFEFPVEKWGMDFQSEHEKFLVEKHFGSPVVIFDYPKEIKAFYMRDNDDGKTVGAMDVLFPGIGEIVGGSQREERYDVLLKKIKEKNIPEKEVWWYLDTRKYGSVPHSGFGLGFERLMAFLTGMGNIRDVIPFPRTPKSAEF